MRVYQAVHNSDTTEGRGHDVTIAFFDNPEEAVKAVQGRGVQGGPGKVFAYNVYTTFSEFVESCLNKNSPTAYADLVYGYRKDWKGSWNYGYVDNRDAPTMDSNYAEFQRLKAVLIEKYGESVLS
jgi:hypothetical protein